MTGVIAVLHDSRIDILADSACIDDKLGRAVGFITKINLVPGTLGVFVCRGPTIGTLIFDKVCTDAQVDGFDNFLSHMETIFVEFDRLMSNETTHNNEVIIAGWSILNSRPILIFRSNHSDHHWVEARAPTFITNFASGLNPIDPNSFTIEQAIDLLEAHRATPLPAKSGGAPLTQVGGWLDHIAITAGGPSLIERVHAWPEDRVGSVLRSAA